MLSIHVANQIAAGEVVERPASVVKELMENAVDAGASRIDVVITAGGRRLISIADDGCGMVRDDAIMAIERQATSKIRTTEDIESISTMGFRGEALASIAAVSRFLIKTRTAHSDVGTEVEVIGGRLNDVRDCGGPVGTTIEVRDIFFNLPARRKFLRSFQTEQTHIRSAFIVQALAHPGLAMTLRCDGQETHRLPACERFEDRLRDLYGPDTLENLRAVEGGFGCVRVSGFVSLPTWTRADRNEQYIFINSRPAVAPILYHAMREAYPPIAGDRKPVIFLFIDLPPESVDVNVHPTKREVRFRNPAEVRDAVIRSISKAIGRAAHSAPDGMRQSSDTATGALSAPLGSAGDWRAGDGQLGGMPNSPGLPDNASQHAAHAAMADALAQAMPASAAPRLDPQRDLPLPALHHRQDPLAPHVPLPQAPANIGAAAGTGAGDTTTSNPDQPTVNMPSGALWKWSRLLGKVGSRYVLFETEEGFVILDPPAAHARVL
jgi:DNA mismatch repair protein MutL